MELIAVYGTLRPGHGNNRLLSTSKHLGTGLTKNKFRMAGRGIPFVSQKQNKNLTQIIVDVFEVTDQVLTQSLDRLEGHPRWYKREKTEIQLDDKVVNAWLYFNEVENYDVMPTIINGDFKNPIYDTQKESASMGL